MTLYDTHPELAEPFWSAPCPVDLYFRHSQTECLAKPHDSGFRGSPAVDWGKLDAWGEKRRQEGHTIVPMPEKQLAQWAAGGFRAITSPDDDQLPLPFKLTGSQKKTAYSLRHNTETMIAGHAERRLVDLNLDDGRAIKAWVTDKPENLHCTGFLTLTIGEYWTHDQAKWELYEAEQQAEWAQYVNTLCPIYGRKFCEKAAKRLERAKEIVDLCPDDEKQHFVQVWDAEEASRRMGNLQRRLLPKLFSRCIVVSERHKNGAVHFHVVGLLACGTDIRTGFDFSAFRKAREARDRGGADLASESRYKISAATRLLELWEELRTKLPKYGFGRAELTPIEKTSDAIACYIAKYIEKNLEHRHDEDKGKKLVRYVGWKGEQLKPNQFSWGTKRASAWRCKMRALAGLVGIEHREEMKDVFGPRWAMSFHRIMQTVDDRPRTWFEWGWAEKARVRTEIVAMAERHLTEREQFAENFAKKRNELSDVIDYFEEIAAQPRRKMVYRVPLSGLEIELAVLN